VFCESASGAKELAKYHPIFEEKIKVVPIFASELIHLNVPVETQELSISNITDNSPFFLYPAQFWPLKNHYNLIQAFKQLVLIHPEQQLKLVLSGADKGNLPYLKKIITQLELENQIVITGYITNETLYALYKHALAMIMPTFLGPTNMPLIEAAYLNCPVLCSNLLGHIEILQEHAIYFHPERPEEMRVAMEKMLSPSFRNSLSEKAFEHICHSKFNIQNSLISLEKYLLEIIPVRKAWGN
jgi:glycosyltransferase involved in cell wall biosynthesis